MRYLRYGIKATKTIVLDVGWQILPPYKELSAQNANRKVSIKDLYPPSRLVLLLVQPYASPEIC